jgi:hypothetical protein
MDDHLVVVATFSFPHEAQIARANLESAGIPAVVENEHTVNMNWLYSNAIGGVRVLVPQTAVDDAMTILEADFSADLEAEYPSENTPTCPHCGSPDLKPYTRGKKSAFLTIVLLISPKAYNQNQVE